MRKRIKIFIGVLFLFTSFLSFSLYIRSGFMRQVDFAVSVKLQERIDTSIHLRLADVVGNVMEGSSFFAGPEFSVVFLLILTGLFCFDFQNKKFHLYGFLIPLLFGLLIAAEVYGKTVIHHPAPPFYMIKNPTTIFPKYYINDQFSYPSGHTARAVFLSMSLYSFLFLGSTVLKNNKNRLIGNLVVSVYICLVSISRIYLGHHWLSDITGGALLGLAMWSFIPAFPGLLTHGSRSHIIAKQ